MRRSFKPSFHLANLAHHFQQRVENLFRGVRLECARAQPGLVTAPARTVWRSVCSRNCRGPARRGTPAARGSGGGTPARSQQNGSPGTVPMHAGPIRSTCSGTATDASRPAMRSSAPGVDVRQVGLPRLGRGFGQTLLGPRNLLGRRFLTLDDRFPKAGRQRDQVVVFSLGQGGVDLRRPNRRRRTASARTVSCEAGDGGN